MKDLQEMVFQIRPEDVGGFAVSVADAKELLDELRKLRAEGAKCQEPSREARGIRPPLTHQVRDAGATARPPVSTDDTVTFPQYVDVPGTFVRVGVYD